MQTNQPALTKLNQIKNYANLLDTKFTIPGTSIRFGLDFIIGLIPFGGHLITFVFSAMLINTMAKHKVSSYVVSRMVLNITIDTIFGSIPILGNIFDLFYKANNRNYELLEKHYGEGKYSGSFWKVLIPAFIFILIVIVLLIWGLVELLDEFFEIVF